MSEVEQIRMTRQPSAMTRHGGSAGLGHTEPDTSLVERSTSRRQVLLGSAGALSALAAGGLFGRAEPVGAAPAANRIAETAGPKQQILQVTLTPLKTSGVVWAQHDWHFGHVFTGSRPPVVVATVVDDYMEHDLTACCVCGVTLHGKPGAYHATIMVRQISKFATSVIVNALAIGD